MSSEWTQLWEVFHRIREADPQSRESYLANLDAHLREEVQELLNSEHSTEQLLEGLIKREMHFLHQSLPEEDGVLEPDQILADRFRIIRLLGKGGMGTVYEGLDQELGSPVALKLLRPDLALDESARERFYREIQLARRVTHPNACRIFDLFHHDHLLFLTMELLPAETLHDKIKREGRMDPVTALPIIMDVAEALTAIHHAGIVHRDLKTSNILLVPNGNGYRTVVTDFGLAVTLPGKEGLPVTQTGQVIGTPEFMAPEQLKKGPITTATDIYAFGLVMYEMVTGKLPFAGESPLTIAAKRISENAPTPRTIVEGLDWKWEQTILRCLERDPRDRFQTSAEAVASLNDSRIKLRFTLLPRRRKRLAVAGVLLFAIVATLFFINTSNRSFDSKGSDMIAKRLWKGATGFPPGALSTDGNTLIDIDWQKADLLSIDLSTAKTRRITNSKIWFHPFDFTSFPVNTLLSPDGKKVVYNIISPFRTGCDLRIIPISGGVARTIHTNDRYCAWPKDWSADEQKIAAIIDDVDGSSKLGVLSLHNDSVRSIKSLDSNNVRKVSFSPNGKQIAYDYPQSHNSPNHDVFLISTDTGVDTRIISNTTNDYVLGWSPDGRSVIFASDRTGTYDAWRINIHDSKPSGSPQLLRKDIGQIYSLRIAADGSLYYAHMMNSTDIYIAQIDAPTSPPVQVWQGTVGSNRSPEFSADGNSLLFQSVANPLATRWSTGAQTINLKILSLKDSREEDFLMPLKSAVGRTRWSPDRRWILVTGESGNDGKKGLFTVDFRNGSTELIVPDLPGNWVRQYYWSADGKAVYYLRNKGGKIVKRNLTDGSETVVYSPAADFALSADGKWIAAMHADVRKGTLRMNVLPSNGAPQRELLRLRMPEWISAFCWTPDGDILFMKGRRDRIDDPHELWRLFVRKGTVKKLGITSDYVYDIRAHPDGKRIALWTVIDTSELWVLENFLPF